MDCLAVALLLIILSGGDFMLEAPGNSVSGGITFEDYRTGRVASCGSGLVAWRGLLRSAPLATTGFRLCLITILP